MAHAIASGNLSHGVASGCSLLLQACFGWFTDIDGLSMACRCTRNMPVAPHSQQYAMHCFNIHTTVSWVTHVRSPSHYVMLTAILNFNPLLRMWADPSQKPSPILPTCDIMNSHDAVISLTTSSIIEGVEPPVSYASMNFTTP